MVVHRQPESSSVMIVLVGILLGQTIDQVNLGADGERRVPPAPVHQS